MDNKNINEEQYPSSTHHPLKISLPYYQYKHSTDNFNSEKDEKGFIGRLNLRQKLYSWLKFGHNKPGSGKKHGCYLITGYRGVGKTAFVNIVVKKYEAWLKWLYGDTHNHLDRLHINLGAGEASSEDILRTITEELYSTTKANSFFVFFSNRKWTIYFLFIFLISCLVQTLFTNNTAQIYADNDIRIVTSNAVKIKKNDNNGAKTAINTQIKISGKKTFREDNPKVSNSYFKLLYERFTSYFDDGFNKLSLIPDPNKYKTKHSSVDNLTPQGITLFDILVPIPLVMFILFSLFYNWIFWRENIRNRLNAYIDINNDGARYISTALGYSTLILLLVYVLPLSLYSASVSFVANKTSRLYTIWISIITSIRQLLKWPNLNGLVFIILSSLMLLILFCTFEMFRKIRKSVFKQHRQLKVSKLLKAVLTFFVPCLVLGTVIFLFLYLPMYIYSWILVCIFAAVIILQYCNLRGDVPFNKRPNLSLAILIMVSKFLFLFVVIAVYSEYLNTYLYDKNEFLNQALNILTYIINYFIFLLLIITPVLFVGGIYHFLFGERFMEPCIHKPGSHYHKENEKDRKKIMIECGKYRIGTFFLQMYNIFKYQIYINKVVVRLRYKVEEKAGVHAKTFSFAGTRSFIPYTFETLEYDLIKAFDMYNMAYPRKDLVIVFDELDKINLKKNTQQDDFVEDNVIHPEQIKAIRTILGDLKNLLGTVEVKFIFISGNELYEHWLMDVVENINLVGSQFATPIVIPTFMTDTTDSKSKEVSSLITKILADSVICPSYDKERIKELAEEVKKSSYIDGILFPMSEMKYVNEHLRNFPSMTSIAYFFAKKYSLEFRGYYENYILNQRFIRAKSSKYIPYYQTFAMRDLIYYITFRSMGIPRSVYLYIEKFVEEGRIKRDLQLSFDETNMHPVQLLSFMFILFHSEINESIKGFGDKIIMSSLYLLNYLSRFHTAAFNRNIIELIPDIITPYHSPELRDIIQRVFNLYKRLCLVTIRNGVYNYRFTVALSTEMRYASLIDATEMAAYNFSFEQSEPVKRYYERHAKKAYKNLPKNMECIKPESISLFLHYSSILFDLAQIYEYEEHYDKALSHYKRSVKFLRAAYPLPEMMTTHKILKKNIKHLIKNEFDVSNIILIIRSFLRIGNAYEHMHGYASAYSYYSQAKDYSIIFFSLFNNFKGIEKDKKEHGFAARLFPHILASPLILQPFFAIEYLLLKSDVISQGVTRVYSIDELTDHLESFREYVDTVKCCKHYKDFKGKKCSRSTCKHSDNNGSNDGSCRDENLQNMYQDINESLCYYISLCYMRKADMNYFSNSSPYNLAVKCYTNALEKQLTSIDLTTTEKGSIYQKENLALIFSHLSDAIFICSEDVDIFIENSFTIKHRKCQLEIKHGGFSHSCILEDEKTHNAIMSFASSLIIKKNDKLLKVIYLSLMGAQYFKDAREYLRAGLQINKICEMLLFSINNSVANNIINNDKNLDKFVDELIAIAMVYFDKAYEHMSKWAEQRDQKLVNTIKTITQDKKNVELYTFVPPEQRNIKLIDLQIKVKQLEKELKEENISLTAESSNDVLNNVKQFASYYAQQIFPVLHRARFMELYGDVFKLLIQYGCNKSQLQIYEYFFEGIRSYKNALDIRNTLGTSFSHTNFSVAELHYKIAELVEVFYAKSKDDKKQLNLYFDYWSREHDFPLSRSDTHLINFKYQYQQAHSYYEQSISAHSIGQSYMDIIRQYCYLNDDFHSEDIHQCVALEVYMRNHSRNQIKKIKAKVYQS